MAAEYEVNIKLNTKNVEQQLKNIDTRTKRTGRMATENINALVKAQDKRARLMNKINELEAKGLNVARLRKQMGQATNELAKRRFGSLQQEFRVLERNVRLEESKLRIMRNQAIAARDRAKFLAGANVGRGQFGPAAPAVQGPRQMIASPIGGATNIKGSPAFLARQRRNQRLGQVGLGAGFPLLFGGGPGAVLGGGLGGLTGSFGAQIALSALGQQVDKFVAGVAAVGTALTSASGTVEMFREKNLFSSDAVKKHAFELEEQGKMQELATLLTKDLASQIGTNAVKSFQNLGGEVKEFLDTINHLFVAVGGFVAGPLAKLLDAINTVLGGVSTDIKFGSLRDSLTGEARAQFDAIVARERGTRQLTGRERQNALRRGESTDPVKGKLTTAVKERVLQDPAIAALRQTINVTGQTTLDDTLGFKPKKDKAAKDAERLAKRLAGLDAERTKLEQLLQLDQQINAAKLEGDNRQIIELENQARLLEFAEKKAVIEASNVPREQKIAELRNLGLERDRALLENAFRLDSFDKQKADDLKLQLDQLDLQLEAATAITREAENQAKLELLLLNLRESNKDLTEDQLEELMNKTRKLFKAQNQGPLQSFITNSVKSLNDLEQHAVQVSQGIGNAIGNSLVNGLQNLVTGATSVKQVFADMLKSIADVLAKQAAQMIATYIAIGVARAFAGMGVTEDAGSSMKVITEKYGDFGAQGAANAAAALPPIKATGGYVSGPSTALVGEGGQGEYIIPESKMRESMARYSRGARGASVIPDSGASGTSGEGGGAAVATPIDVRYTVERINSVDYVTADQFQAGMRQAADQGAKQGEQRALLTLRQNTSQRRRIGI